MQGFRSWSPIESIFFSIGLAMSWGLLWPFISGRLSLIPRKSLWFRASVWQISLSTSSWVLWPIFWPGLIAPLWLGRRSRMAPLSCACCDQCILRPLTFHRTWLQVVDFYLCWTAILSVIVLMKILSGQGIVEVLGLTILYLFSLTLAYLINFFFNICFGFSAFVFKNLWGSNLLKTSIVAFMSGSLIPLTFFPKVVSDILSFLPFSSLIYTPVMIIVGKYDASQILQALLLQFFWLLVMAGLSQLIWKRVQSFITIQGG